MGLGARNTHTVPKEGYPANIYKLSRQFSKEIVKIWENNSLNVAKVENNCYEECYKM